jgi:pimeloyl-ACP methyl ester carboxylesterase
VSSTPTVPRTLHYVDHSPVRGLAIAERRVEAPEGTLICIHGGLDRGASFGRVARRLETFDVVAYDRRGYQRSRDLAPLSLELHIDDLLAVASAEAARGPVLYFGHSYGGVVALGAALANPPLAQLVMAYEAPLPWILMRESSRPPLTNDGAMESEIFFKRLVSRGAWERLSENERESRRLDGPALVSDLTTLTTDPPFNLADLNAPSVFVHGDGILADYYRALSRKLEQVSAIISTREIHQAGHGAHLSNPDQVAALIRELWEQRCALA